MPGPYAGENESDPAAKALTTDPRSANDGPPGDGSNSAADLACLVGRIAAGQRDALKPLYDATADLAYRAALRVLERPELAEDAVANAFVQVWIDARRFDPTRASVRGWIVMLARTRALDIARTLSAHGGLDSLPEDTATDAEVVVDAALQAEESEIIRREIAALPEEEREALTCAFFDGLTHVEIAEHLDAPLGTIKARVRRALDRLRTQLRSLRTECQRREPAQHRVQSPATWPPGSETTLGPRTLSPMLQHRPNSGRSDGAIQ